MKKQICSMDYQIDQVEMSEAERENIKAQLHRVEVMLSGIEVCVLGVNRLMKSLTHSWGKGASQH